MAAEVSSPTMSNLERLLSFDGRSDPPAPLPGGKSWVLHFDVNGPLIHADTRQGQDAEYMTKLALARQVIESWDGGAPCSFRDHTWEVCATKPEKRKMIGDILTHLRNKDRSLFELSSRVYHRALEIIGTYPAECPVLPAFFNLVSYVPSATFHLDSFGDDLDVVKTCIEGKTDLRFEGPYASDEKGNLPPECSYEASKVSHLATKHSWAYWHANGEKATFGKSFLIDPADTKWTSVFFDDNAKRDDAGEYSIVRPITPSGDSLPLAPLFGRNVIQVNPLEAIFDPHHYSRVLEGIHKV